MLHKLSTVKSVIARFWTTKPPIVDEVELQADLMSDDEILGEFYALEEKFINELIAERDKHMRHTKRSMELHKELERVRLAQLAREISI